MKIAILKTSDASSDLLKSVEEYTQLPVYSSIDPEKDYFLKVERNRLSIFINKPKAPHPIEVDFLSGEWDFKIKTLNKNQLIFKAIGLDKQPPSVLDATAGLGQDLFSFLIKGCRVTAIEMNPYIYLVLKTGLQLAFESKKWSHLKDNLVLLNTNSENFISESKNKYDAIYLDPMYGNPSEKSKSKKEMEFLRDFLNPFDNSQNLLNMSLKSALKRVVIKRPIDSPLLEPAPTHSYKGRSTRFDMYITNN